MGLRNGVIAGCTVAFVAVVACGGGGKDGDPSADGGADAPIAPGFGDDGGALPGADGRLRCQVDASCPKGDRCTGGLCQPSQANCVSNAGCQNDAYCDPAGVCRPYGTAPDNKETDTACKLSVAAGVIAPMVKCEFKPPAGDPFAQWIDVQATPIVVNFNVPDSLEGRAPKPPSVVVPFTVPLDTPTLKYTENRGVVRVLRGTDCELEANIGGTDIDGNGQKEWARSSSPVAVADLDGDKVADIVMFMVEETTRQESLVAWTRKAGAWAPLWSTKKATQTDGTTAFNATTPAVDVNGNGNWGAPSIHDVDDDGKPEIVREGWVFDGQTGRLRVAPPAGYASAGVGLAPVLANMDADPRVEMTNGAGLWELDPTGNAWVADATYNAVTSPPGFAAVADFDPYDGQKRPEIVVTAGGKMTVYKQNHTVFMGLDVTVPGGGGGPPTIADYDGDGLPEIGVAGQAFYTVYDPDCGAAPRPGGKCADRTRCDHVAGGACPANILWSRASQDDSSNITGSSIFDFEADGKAEVVYADECFVRVYDGSTGKVLFSQASSSCTWLENPVVADVDGDFRAELVVGSNTACGVPGTGILCTRSVEANGVDKQFAGQNCQKASDCISGSCVEGLCRCTATAQCCALKDDAKCGAGGWLCAPPPAGTAGAGKTCRAVRTRGYQGIRIFEDALDRWVRSRAIWNQHAYAVTHVNEDGTVPRTSSWSPNWTTPGLDNFRQNVPGSGTGQDAPDLTAQAGPLFACVSGKAQMNVPICNRGTAPAKVGIPVAFYVADKKVCETTTPDIIGNGKCVTVSCSWDGAPTSASEAVDVAVRVDEAGSVAECTKTNNGGRVQRVFCKPPT